MKRWIEVLDHGDDPGRYTLIQGDGQIVTVNENGSVVFQRRCHNPYGMVSDLTRQPGVRIVKPAQRPELLKKIGQHEDLEEKPTIRNPKNKEFLPDEVKAKLIAYARRKWPHGDYFTARVSWNGNFVVTVDSNYPLLDGIGEEQMITPKQYEDLDTILDKR